MYNIGDADAYLVTGILVLYNNWHIIIVFYIYYIFTTFSNLT